MINHIMNPFVIGLNPLNIMLHLQQQGLSGDHHEIEFIKNSVAKSFEMVS